MGTNYYHERDGYEGAKCTRCGGFCSNCEAEARVHIGKSSAGWTFGFHATPEIRSYADWQRALESGGRIVDEYGDVMTLHDFRVMVLLKSEAPNHHARQYPGEYPGHRSFVDPDGHSFSEGDFS